MMIRIGGSRLAVDDVRLEYFSNNISGFVRQDNRLSDGNPLLVYPWWDFDTDGDFEGWTGFADWDAAKSVTFPNIAAGQLIVRAAERPGVLMLPIRSTPTCAR